MFLFPGSIDYIIYASEVIHILSSIIVQNRERKYNISAGIVRYISSLGMVRRVRQRVA